jgi:uncharacterized protein YciI
MRETFVTLSVAGPKRDHAKDTRNQAHWDEHAAFIDALVAEGFILMGGPLVDEGGALLIVQAVDECEVRARLQDDPWYREGILRLDSIKRWQIFIDERQTNVLDAKSMP